MDVMSEQHEQKKNCISTCPDSLLLYENWRCISTEKCSEKKTRFNAETIGMERSYKNYKGKCLEHCPPDTEEEIIQSENISTCKKCDDCAKECPGQTIRSLETLKKFQGCTKIMGDLTIQITGSKFIALLHIYLFLSFVNFCLNCQNYPILSQCPNLSSLSNLVHFSPFCPILSIVSNFVHFC